MAAGRGLSALTQVYYITGRRGFFAPFLSFFIRLRKKKKQLTFRFRSDILLKQNKAGTALPSSPSAREAKGSTWYLSAPSLGACQCVVVGALFVGTRFFIANCETVKWRCFHISNMSHQINDDIRDREVRLIAENGDQLGIMATRDAMAKAEENNLDLVKISPTANPPVCKLMDYGKYKFEQAKREKEARKNQRIVEIKEVRMSPGIDSNDFNVKLRNAQKFLSEGDRVKATVRFRGREMAHTSIGRELLFKFAADCAEVAVMDKEPKLEGRHMNMFLSPKAAKEPKVKEKGDNQDA